MIKTWNIDKCNCVGKCYVVELLLYCEILSVNTGVVKAAGFMCSKKKNSPSCAASVTVPNL